MNSAERLAKAVLPLDISIAVAESCTGGMIGSEITSVPGASSYFMGSAVTYSNDSKEKILDVSRKTLETKGAVSEEAAEQMAIGVRSLYSADASIAVTGIAGPDGGTPEKPVGLVYIAVSYEERTVVRKCNFNGDRDEIRRCTVETSLEMLSDLIERKI